MLVLRAAAAVVALERRIAVRSKRETLTGSTDHILWKREKLRRNMSTLDKITLKLGHNPLVDRVKRHFVTTVMQLLFARSEERLKRGSGIPKA